MKGIILAGGQGTRLFPSTKVVNKHLLPVYNKPMIFYPLNTLTKSGITDILIISNRESIASFMTLLGSGSEVHAQLTYKVQEGASGIAHALSIAEDFAHGEAVALILGDNIFIEAFEDEVKQFKSGAKIFLKEVDDPKRFGIAELSGVKVISIEEKPLRPKSSYAVTGLYLYDAAVFSLIKKLTPSDRGELEITDLNKKYIDCGAMEACFLKHDWADAGTHDALMAASRMVQQQEPSHESILKTTTIPKVSIGILAYQTEKYRCVQYLDACFQSLLKQDYSNIEIFVLDNGSTDKEYLEEYRQRFPEITFLESEKNLGFGAGHNKLIRKSSGQFYAAFNFDMIYEPDFISRLVQGITSAHDIGAVTGKLKQWNFKLFQSAQAENNTEELGKTNFIDSTGIRIRKSHRFEDRGQGEVDYGQYDREEDIFGPSGAAALYRRAALEHIAFVNDKGEKEYFDELFFMYKEDIDLAYRLQWAGWRARYIPAAAAYHDRTVTQDGIGILAIMQNRRRKSKQVNEWSFLNQEIILQKHFERTHFSHAIKQATKWYKFKSLLYILLFEPHLLKQYKKLRELAEQIEKRIVRMPKRTSVQHIESLMED